MSWVRVGEVVPLGTVQEVGWVVGGVDVVDTSRDGGGRDERDGG